MKILSLEMAGCPYCRQAKEIINELKEEHPEYSELYFDWKDENKNQDLVSNLDYYYVPSFYCGDTKLYEAAPRRDRAEAKSMINEMMRKLTKD